MAHLRLVPLDDVVVFPGMPVTLPADVGGDDRVLLIPRRGSGYAKVGVVAEVTERVAIGGRGVASFMPLHRGLPGAAHDRAGRRPARGGRGASGPGSRAEPDPRARARVPGGGGGDPRAARRRRPDQRLRPLDHPSGRAGGHGRLLAGPELRAEAGAARGPGRGRAADPRPPLPAGAPGGAARSQAHPRRGGVGDAEAAARVPAAPADGRDPQGARRERGLGGRGVSEEDRRRGHAGGGPEAGRARAGAARADGGVERRRRR